MKTVSYFLILMLIISQPAFSSRDSGGGDHMSEPFATIGEIEHVVEKIKPTLWSKFYGLLRSGDNFGADPKNRPVYIKLFDHDPDETLYYKLPPGKETDHEYMKSIFPYFKQLDRSVFIVDKTKPCYDGRTPKDAAVIDAEKGTICISAFTLSQKISASRTFEYLAAIMAHEISHLVTGITEADAQRLQEKYFIKSMSRSVIDRFYDDYSGLERAIRDVLDSLEPKWSSSIDLNNPAITERCLQIGEFSGKIAVIESNKYKMSENYGTLIVDDVISKELRLATLRMSYLKLYCTPEDSHKKEYIRKYGKPIIVPGETDGFYQETQSGVPTGMYFRYVPYLENGKMREEMDSIAKQVTKIRELIWKNEQKFRENIRERGLFK